MTSFARAAKAATLQHRPDDSDTWHNAGSSCYECNGRPRPGEWRNLYPAGAPTPRDCRCVYQACEGPPRDGCVCGCHEQPRTWWRCEWCGSTVELEYEKNASLNHRGGCGLPCEMFCGKPEKWVRVVEIKEKP